MLQKDEWALQRRWMEAFIPEVRAKKGRFPPAPEMLNHLKGSVGEALGEHLYAQEKDGEVALLFTENLPTLRCSGPAPPPIPLLRMLQESSTNYLDIAVCPLSCRWTILISHEDYQYFSFSKAGPG
jgi:hypothetical protein